MVKLGTVFRMSSFTSFKFCFLNLLSDPFGLPRPFGVVVGVFVDRVPTDTNSAFTVFLLSDPFGLPRPFGVVVGVFVDRVSAVTNSAFIVFLLNDPFGLPRPLGVVVWGLLRFCFLISENWFDTVGFKKLSSSSGIVALFSAYRDFKTSQKKNFQSINRHRKYMPSLRSQWQKKVKVFLSRSVINEGKCI